MRRVVVTGLGVMSALGNTPGTFFDSLIAGRSGIRHWSRTFPEDPTPRLTAEVDFDPSKHFSRMRCNMLDRTSMLALLAAKQAFADSNIQVDQPEAFGIHWGTGAGGANTTEEAYRGARQDPPARVKPTIVVMAMNNAAASEISLEYGLQGPSYTYSIACSSAAVAIGEAYRAICYGHADCMVAGGADSILTIGMLKAWHALQTLALENVDDPGSSCRPFAKDRTGFIIGEGAGALILEEADHAMRRGAKIYAEIAGFGTTSDAQHITKPSPAGQARAISLALREAQLAPSDIGYVNAHGTATSVGDVAETEAMKIAFGDAARHVPISSTKSMHGHLMGATGGVEFIAALLAMQRGVVPPTAHLFHRDPDCDLDYVPLQARQLAGINAVMSNSFAFGGNNAVLIAKRFSGA
ncbi:MAG: beta-ketoacyl-[acyl-carrier-protein] synthase family protein [Burkholderiales bacterium]